MREKLKSIKNSYLTYAIFFVIILILIGVTVSYAYFQVNSANSSTASNIGVSLACMDITYSEIDTISLDYNYPINDIYALENIKPVTISVTNNCTAEDSNVTYTLAISSLYNDEGYIGDDQIRMQVSRTMPNESKHIIRTPMYLNMVDAMPAGNALVALKEDLKTRENANAYQNTSSYIIDSNTIAAGNTVTYEVYLWVDYYEGDVTRTGLRDNSTEGKDFAAAISIITNDDLHDLELGTAYALYTEDNSTLTFVRSVTPYTKDDTYNNLEITDVYTGFEETTYESAEEVPWYNYIGEVTSVVVENVISPISTAYWFLDAGCIETMDLTKLITSRVTNMSYMFSNLGRESAVYDTGIIITGFENWDVSNVSNMHAMFSYVVVKQLKDIENWDVSNVIDMSEMFVGTVIYEQLDLSGWNVKNVREIGEVFTDVSEITPPVWNTTS